MKFQLSGVVIGTTIVCVKMYRLKAVNYNEMNKRVFYFCLKGWYRDVNFVPLWGGSFFICQKVGKKRKRYVLVNFKEDLLQWKHVCKY